MQDFRSVLGSEALADVVSNTDDGRVVFEENFFLPVTNDGFVFERVHLGAFTGFVTIPTAE
jgi:hypothetical protein